MSLFVTPSSLLLLAVLPALWVLMRQAARDRAAQLDRFGDRKLLSKGSALPGTASEPGGFFDAALPAKLPTLPLALAEVRSVATAIGTPHSSVRTSTRIGSKTMSDPSARLGEARDHAGGASSWNR